jgi:hypothetical protein
MDATFEADTRWERIVSELRAQRAAQKEAWGDLDNATLGRYLAGEVSGAERAEIERLLEGLPDLRYLTDVVRDVLAEFEPVAAPAPFEAPPPVVLSFPRSASRPARTPIRRQRVALFAAAAVLLVVGLGVLKTIPASPPRPDSAPVARSNMALAVNTLPEQPQQFHVQKLAVSPQLRVGGPLLAKKREPGGSTFAASSIGALSSEGSSLAHQFTSLLLDTAIACVEQEDEQVAQAPTVDDVRLLNSRKHLVTLYNAQNSVTRPTMFNPKQRNTANSPVAPRIEAANHTDRRRVDNLEKRVVVLHYCLHHGDDLTKARAVGVLSDLGAPADRMVPDLVDLLAKTDNPQLAGSVRAALTRLAPTSTPRLMLLLLTGDEREKTVAAEILHQAGSGR